MKKTLSVSILTFLIALLLTACGCKHEWQEASCTTPKTCTLCQETEGEPLSHNWLEASCTQVKQCTVCSLTEGEFLPHTWKKASCSFPKTCTICEVTEGEPLGHTWIEATCTAPKTCSACRAISGTKLSHAVEIWNQIKKPSCSEEGNETGTCALCTQEITQVIPKLDHTESKWVIITEATDTEAGVRSMTCKVCKTEIVHEEYELTEEEKVSYYKKSCSKYTYDEVARNPDAYFLDRVFFQGTVIQSMEDGDEYVLRVRTARNKILLVWYTREKGQPRILEDDYIKLYGTFTGTYTYETVMGNDVTIPSMMALYAEY